MICQVESNENIIDSDTASHQNWGIEDRSIQILPETEAEDLEHIQLERNRQIIAL